MMQATTEYVAQLEERVSFLERRDAALRARAERLRRVAVRAGDAVHRYEREDTGYGHVRGGVAWAMRDDLRDGLDHLRVGDLADDLGNGE